ncbi:hypothetical protein [Vibrio rotiferianus]|uniref:hypothetical protein n=1 Tax=Vibrio rotiferianus TaxID=190895 RepID=UPI00148B6786|nr:hypothetical protein [Vibrio rotiferianus]NOH65965.1 hypothetical protein [Vibrio rotiferianus]
MKKKLSLVHRISSISAYLLIMSFFTSTVVVELFGDQHAILAVKTYISYAIWAVVPLMAVAGITGAKMAPNVKKGPLAAKKKRMPFVAMNGVLVLVPAAIYLQHLAAIGQFDTTFFIVQVVELIAGFINLTLMTLNIRDAKANKKPKKTPKQAVM